MAQAEQYHHSGLKYVALKAVAGLVRTLAGAAAGKETAKALESIPDTVKRTRIEVPSRDDGRTVTVDVYEKQQPNGTADAVGGDGKKKPVLLNFHGSGFVIESLGQDAEWCSLIASRTDFVVLDTNYRKSPEYPFPAAMHDVEDVIRYARSHADYDADKLVVSGFSAGGNLAMTLALSEDVGAVKAVAAFYANSDMTKGYPAPSNEYDSGVVLPQWLRSFFYACYIPPSQSRADPRLSPLFAEQERWPKHVFLACGKGDNLYEPNQVLYDKIKTYEGVQAEWMPIEREAHAFDKSAKPGSPSEERKKKMYDAALDLLVTSVKSP